MSQTTFHAPKSSTGLGVDDIPEVLAQGGDWEDVLKEIEKITNERIVLNMGPVHPSTHGVLRLILELDGETVRETRVDTGYLHTGIEKQLMSQTTFHAPKSSAGLGVDDIPEVLAQGGDWEDVLKEIEKITSERIVLNMGPVHPSTHGVLRLILELDGETVRETRVDTGYLHTGIEKNMEYRTWTQGVTFATRMDYVAPFFQEVAYCLAVEKLLGITDEWFLPSRKTSTSWLASWMAVNTRGPRQAKHLCVVCVLHRKRDGLLRLLPVKPLLRPRKGKASERIYRTLHPDSHPVKGLG